MRDLIEALCEAMGVPGRGRGPGKGDPANCPRRKAGLGPRRKRDGSGPTESSKPGPRRS